MSTFEERNMKEQTFGTSKNIPMQEILKLIEKISLKDVNLILVGEQGTGKEWLARAIHQSSTRAQRPFWPIDCDSISPDSIEKELFGYEAISQNGIIINRGAFEDASGGTLLLNHIECLPQSIQKKLARTLEYKTIHRVGDERAIPIDLRVIVSLGQQSDSLIRKGKLEKDMFFRISPIVIELPSLRHRREDIPLLIEKFIVEMQLRQRKPLEGITPAALELCLAYDWPGNIRNLRSAIEYASIMSSSSFIQPVDLPDYLYNHHSKRPAASASIF
jgi:two-component system, NtrC family, response regulator HydG